MQHHKCSIWYGEPDHGRLASWSCITQGRLQSSISSSSSGSSSTLEKAHLVGASHLGASGHEHGQAGKKATRLQQTQHHLIDGRGVGGKQFTCKTHTHTHTCAHVHNPMLDPLHSNDVLGTHFCSSLGGRGADDINMTTKVVYCCVLITTISFQHCKVWLWPPAVSATCPVHLVEPTGAADSCPTPLGTKESSSIS